MSHFKAGMFNDTVLEDKDLISERLDDCYAYTTVFNINSEQDLDDFWSYCIFRLNMETNENNYDRFARLYNLLNENKNFLSPSNYFNISLNESDEKFYLRIKTTIESMIHKFIKRLESLKLPYTYEQKVLSYSIDKIKSTEIRAAQNPQVVKHKVYDFITQNDLDEMTACIDKMRDGNYNKIYIEDISSYKSALLHYSSFLQMYPQLKIMDNIIAELCMVLSLHSDDCADLGMDFRRLLQSFINNIWHWQESLFVMGSEELHFMDDSFKADLSQIKMTLNLYDEVFEEEELALLDDIFEF